MTSIDRPTTRFRHLPLVIWSVGLLAYTVTVMQRTTLAVAGLPTAERFDLSPGALTTFAFLQLAVFAAMQIPAGFLVDRFGSRALLVVNGVIMFGAQLMIAHATTFATAATARVFVGVADAIVFAATLALIPYWFAPGKVPVVTQLTTIICQLGQVLSAVPFVYLLQVDGWTTAYTAAASLSAMTAILAFALVRNDPTGRWKPTPIGSVGTVARTIKAVWRRPATRLGFFGHMGTQFPMMVFSLLWGMPYLVKAQGLSQAMASTLIMLMVIAGIVIGPMLGVLTSHHPLRRSWLILTIIGAAITIWTIILMLPGPAPVWLLVILVVVLAAGGPGSVVGLDIARTASAPETTGISQGIANLGGFIASLIVLAGMGVLMNGKGGFTAESFHTAWMAMYPMWAIAIIGIVLSRRTTRRIDAENGIVPRPIFKVLAHAL